MNQKINDLGYGRFRLKNQKTLAHRAAFEFFFGAYPRGALVLHHCDNPSCVNPAHLFLGTNKDNHDDAVKKGRINPSTRAKKRWIKCPTLRKS